MEGETSNNDVIKLEAAAPDVEVAVEPILVQRCCSGYKECRRNHAASFGRYAIDGCGEFICCNDDIFICAACGCHRSFHCKDYPPNLNLPPPPQQTFQTPYLAPLPLASHNGLTGETSLFIKNDDVGFQILGGPENEDEKDTKKRTKRTRLTLEQKNKMVSFADKLGWRSLRQNEAEMQQFCEEVGITKRVFVVWLNNNRRRKDSMCPNDEFL